MRFVRFAFIAAALAALVVFSAAWLRPPQQDAMAAAPVAGYKLTKEVPLPDDGGQDYLAEDSANRRLFISHATEVVVVDMDTLAVLGKVPNTNGVHGIAISDKDGHAFSSNGRDNTLTEFDVKTLATIKVINSPKEGVDGIMYDPATDSIVVLCGDSSSAVVVNAATGDVVGSVDLGGQPEFAAADGKGHVFNALESTSELADIDVKALKVVHRYPLAPCNSPSGVSMDTAHRRVFVGCRNSMMAIVNADTGAVIATPAIGNGVDATRFDPGTGLAFASNGNSTITVVHEDSPDKFTLVGNIASVPGGKCMALDTKTHTLYTATRKYGAAPAAPAGGRAPRPPAIPNSFTLFVFTRS